jgi:EmrB/QacA subfamily drug resistance transporter
MNTSTTLRWPRLRINRPALLLGIVCAAQFMVILDISIVNVALPSIRTSLGFSTTGLQWVVNAYTLTFAGLLMLGGRAVDLLGRRRMFLLGTALFALASLLCALTSSRGLLLGARALQGVGGAVVSPATLAIITTSFKEGSERNRALGMWGATGGLGASAGALFGGLLTQTVGWPAIFLINVPIGLVVIIGARAMIAEGRRESSARHFDLAGALLITVGLFALVFGIVRTDTLGWGSSGVLGPIALGAVALALFIWVEARFASSPLVPLHIFARPLLRAANLVALLLYAALFSMWFFVTLYLQQVLHYTALQAGLAFLPMTLAVAGSSTIAPRLVSSLGARRTITIGMLFGAGGMAWFSALHEHSSYLLGVLPGGILAAIGLGLSLVPATIVAVQGVPASESGLASGLLNTSRLMGGALGLAALSTLAAAHTRGALAAGEGSAQALTGGFDRAFLAGAAICLLGALAAAALIRRPAGTQPALTAPSANAPASANASTGTVSAPVSRRRSARGEGHNQPARQTLRRRSRLRSPAE